MERLTVKDSSSLWHSNNNIEFENPEGNSTITLNIGTFLIENIEISNCITIDGSVNNIISVDSSSILSKMYIYDSSINNLNTNVLTGGETYQNNLFIENSLDISYIIISDDLSSVDFKLNNFSDICFNYPDVKGIDYINNPDFLYSNLIFNT